MSPVWGEGRIESANQLGHPPEWELRDFAGEPFLHSDRSSRAELPAVRDGTELHGESRCQRKSAEELGGACDCVRAQEAERRLGIGEPYLPNLIPGAQVQRPLDGGPLVGTTPQDKVIPDETLTLIMLVINYMYS